MKITKYDVHVHEVKPNGKLNPQQIVGRYFYVSNDDIQTIKSAIGRSDLEEFRPYINNSKYQIHMVTDQVLEDWEREFFIEAISKDHDPCNFFMTRKKCRGCE